MQLKLLDIEKWLRETDDAKLEELWREVDSVRHENVGDDVHLRGLVEISNYCVRSCAYCGLRLPNKKIERYRMSEDEILACAHETVSYGYGTIVLQSGEDYGIKTDWLVNVIKRIKSETNLAVTLSLGERPHEDLEKWRKAGADRYLIRFETSDQKLYDRIHPPVGDKQSDRFAILNDLRDIGFEIGGGVMVGIPGQSYTSLAKDIDLFRTLDLDMIGVGPFIPHPDTPLGSGEMQSDIASEEQVPATEDMVYKVIALARLVRPDANIPSTTALATINREDGREKGLQRGANIAMPNLTPLKYRTKYTIYPGKACLNETAEVCKGCLEGRITSIGRKIGRGHGGRRNKK